MHICACICNIIQNIYKHIAIFGSRLGKGGRREALFTVYPLPSIFFHLHLQLIQKQFKRLQPTNQNR